MARGQSSCNPILLKSLVVVLGICLAAYILGPPLYWHLAEGIAALSHDACPPCICDCAYEPMISLPAGFSNSTFTVHNLYAALWRSSKMQLTTLACGKRDSEVSEEMEDSFTELLSEELKLQEAAAVETQRRSDIALLEAKKLASQYQKEADKCNSGMETCEEARDKAEAALLAQRKLTQLWEQRARQKGWKEGIAKY